MSTPVDFKTFEIMLEEFDGLFDKYKMDNVARVSFIEMLNARLLITQLVRLNPNIDDSIATLRQTYAGIVENTVVLLKAAYKLREEVTKKND
jgi:hypothetical protein